MLKKFTKLAIVVTIAQLATTASFADTQAPNGYEGYKIPPLEISAENKYEYNYLDIFGSKMAYISMREKVIRFFSFMVLRCLLICGVMLCHTLKIKDA